MRRLTLGLALLLLMAPLGAILAVAPSPARAQPAAGIVRLALLPLWVLTQHRGGGAPGAVSPQLRAALDGGVVDRVVFWWQRGVIHRESLVWKPVRVLDGAEAAALGGRGTFELVAVRPPTGGAAWTEIEVAGRTGGPEDVLVLEVGGEVNTIRQVLDTLLVTSRDGALAELGLARRALIPGDGVPVITAPFGRPVVLREGPGLFRGTGGVDFLVARSPVQAIEKGGITTNGLADLAPFQAGEWREGDRVFLRAPGATLRAGVPPIVLGWRDRTYRPDGGDTDQLRRSSFKLPLLR